MSLELIIGPMFAGKSTELMTRLKRSIVLEDPMVLVKPNIDTRYSKTDVVTHNGYSMPAQTILHPKELYSLAEQYPLIAIDEVQFLDGEIVEILQEICKEKRVVAAGLGRDYRGEWFPLPNSDYTMSDLVKISDNLTRLSAYCMYRQHDRMCGERAFWTQRLTKSDSTIELGGSDEYHARCRKHYET